MLKNQPSRSSGGPEIRRPGRNVAKILAAAVLAVVAVIAISSIIPESVEVKFDGNGADEGSMRSQKVFKGDAVTLPACEFNRDGYLFAYWTTNLGKGVGTPEYLVGDEYMISGPVTFFANWVKRIPLDEVAVTGEGEDVSGDFPTFDNKSGRCVLVVTNDSNETLALDASFTFYDKDGFKRGSIDDQAVAVKPGGMALLVGMDVYGSQAASYRLTSSKPVEGMNPLGGSVICEEVSVSPDEVVVELTNNGSEDAQIFRVSCLARDTKGNAFAGDSYTTAAITPGKSIQVVFQRSSMFDYRSDYPIVPAFDELQREYFIDGFMGALEEQN